MFAVVFGLLFIALGSLLIYGTFKRWRMLVDPPEDLWLVYSHSFIKRLFGQRFLVLFNYFMGALFMLLAGLGIWNGLHHLCSVQ